jgi:hypothetical protein
MQCFTAFPIFLQSIVPALEKGGVHDDLIVGQRNASLESQLFFLRKLNEFFKPLINPKTGQRMQLKEDDVRAEDYSGFKSSGKFLSDDEEDEIHKRVGHITLSEVRRGKKDWAELIKRALPAALDRLLEFFLFLRDQYSLSASARQDVEFYIERVTQLKKLV